jgi:hypothetical protein
MLETIFELKYDFHARYLRCLAYNGSNIVYQLMGEVRSVLEKMWDD